MIINIPIEPLDQRYTAEWLRWFPEHFRRLKVPHRTINPTLEVQQGELSSDRFLNTAYTLRYKAAQLGMILNMLDQDEMLRRRGILFFNDLWFPGLEALFYYRQDTPDAGFKITGILHAGTYDPWDRLSRKGMGRWGKQLEESWLEEIDLIFLSCPFHRDLLLEQRKVAPHKLRVTGLPIYPPEFERRDGNRRDRIVFPHRLAPEKQPHLFNALAETYRDNETFLERSKDKPRTKQEYHQWMIESKIAVSFALQETWGIAMQEAVFCGCVPVVPDRLAYRDLYPQEFRYRDFEEAVDMVDNFLVNYYQITTQTVFIKMRRNLVDKGSAAIPNMIGELRNEGWIS